MTLPNSGPIARRAAADALLPGNLSVREEGGNNKGKFIAIYLATVNILVPAAWCAAWAVYRLIKAAQALGKAVPPDFPKTGWTPSLAAWAKKNGYWIENEDAAGKVQVGDLALFHFSNLGRIGHVGIVVEVGKGGCWTVEGNTRPDPGVSRESSDGRDGVYRKWRSWAELGSKGGFARLPW
jgi:CHAP domain.